MLNAHEVLVHVHCVIHTQMRRALPKRNQSLVFSPTSCPGDGVEAEEAHPELNYPVTATPVYAHTHLAPCYTFIVRT